MSRISTRLLGTTLALFGAACAIGFGSTTAFAGMITATYTGVEALDASASTFWHASVNPSSVLAVGGGDINVEVDNPPPDCGPDMCPDPNFMPPTSLAVNFSGTLFGEFSSDSIANSSMPALAFAQAQIKIDNNLYNIGPAMIVQSTGQSQQFDIPLNDSLELTVGLHSVTLSLFVQAFVPDDATFFNSSNVKANFIFSAAGEESFDWPCVNKDPPPKDVPELDPGSFASALTLLTGGVLVLTGRRRGMLAIEAP